MFLRSLKWDAEKRGVSLADSLKDAALSKIELTGQGLTLVSTSSRGHSVAFAERYQKHSYSPTDITELIEELLTRYDQAKASLADQSIPAPSDDQILAEMMVFLVPSTEFRNDFVYLRTA